MWEALEMYLKSRMINMSLLYLCFGGLSAWEPPRRSPPVYRASAQVSFVMDLDIVFMLLFDTFFSLAHVCSLRMVLRSGLAGKCDL